ncbi:MAG: type II toxin-antitoxin system VapC family toxin [Treponema sp.]|nr:type II toxin-antitoxin system VapC family toxin [Treponema sp.]
MMPLYLLDTNAVSEFSKPRPNESLLARIKEHEEMCAICSTVWQELVRGCELLPDGKRKDKIGVCIEKIRETYEIIPYDNFAAQICGEIQAKCEKKGKPIPRYDSQIAATAIANGMVLITHNVQDFEALKENSMLKVEDWWG